MGARVNDGYSIYGQYQTNDVYCEAFAWGTDKGSIKSALKGNALFEIGFANMLNGSVEQIPGAPLCGCLDRMPVVTNTKCTQVTSADSSVDVTFVKSLGVFDSTFNLGTITSTDCGTLLATTRNWKAGLTLLTLLLLPTGLWELRDVPMPLQLSLQPRNWDTRWKHKSHKFEGRRRIHTS